MGGYKNRNKKDYGKRNVRWYSGKRERKRTEHYRVDGRVQKQKQEKDYGKKRGEREV